MRAFTLPEATIILTSVDLLQAMGAVVELVRVKPLSTNVTPVVPLLTLTEPSAQLPLRTYVPESFIVSEVPSIL